MNLRLLLVFVLLFSQASGYSGNWPHWRGPNMNGVVEEKNLPVRWSTTENITWKLAMPDFTGSTPIIWGDHIFLNIADGTELYLWCRNAKTGEEIWGDQRVSPGTYSASPVVADGKLYVTSEDGITTVLEAGREFKILAENDLSGYTLSSPAISDGQIFMRTDKHLFCIGKRSSAAK